MSLKERLTADLPTLFNLSEFADQATATPLDGAPFTLDGLFDDAFEAISPVTGAVELTRPQFVCRAADVAALRQNDWLEVGTVAYRIVGIEPDGTGVTRLLLSKDRPDGE